MLINIKELYEIKNQKQIKRAPLNIFQFDFLDNQQRFKAVVKMDVSKEKLLEYYSLMFNSFVNFSLYNNIKILSIESSKIFNKLETGRCSILDNLFNRTLDVSDILNNSSIDSKKEKLSYGMLIIVNLLINLAELLEFTVDDIKKGFYDSQKIYN